MALIEQHVDVTTKYGKCRSFAACPEEPGQYPGIIFYMDAPGYRTELENMARRIAKMGYFCLLPDMYYRLGTCRFDIPRRNEGMSAVIFAAMHHLDNQMVAEDTGGWIAWLDAQDKCAPGPIGVVGHCMSGQYVTAVGGGISRPGSRRRRPCTGSASSPTRTIHRISVSTTSRARCCSTSPKSITPCPTKM